MKITFELTREDFSDFQKYDFKKNKLKNVVLMVVVLLVVLQVFLNKDGFDLKATIISSLTSILLYVFLIKRRLNRTKRIPDENGEILGFKEFDFREDKIHFVSKNSEGSYKWESLKSIEESSNSFFLYIDKNMAIPIPKHAFNDKQEIEFFRAYVSRKIKASQ